ncbi:signal peptide protein [Legionella geestiana]|uniref:Signal peptide protein n=1 Tax=Legionella geestiana TaxID=45065 RepID=A0A0W0U7Y7_9GAMM|nr:DUF2282 domain-containing protein [Legionella geestiana]KTD03773.1 signal peptide protein [Legionella geestiana]QBS11941.1 DUF2282 domain-containing protein [Legionella geestiana]QDQ40446.1 DUF2282 domain-containing protein [Legionella geestiana]STX53346.1 signal peptide protein [Legionella geestiana]
MKILNDTKAARASLAMAVFLSLAANPASADTSDVQQEKCYGISRAGMNDCATATASCAGSATRDNQPDAFIFLPKGLCTRITGASLTAGTSPASTDNKPTE